MARREKLYERKLRRPVDAPTLDAVRSEFHRRRHEIPVAAELLDHPTRPEMTIRTKWASFIVQFGHGNLRVDAELSLAARVLATAENRRLAVHLIDQIANDLNL